MFILTIEAPESFNEKTREFIPAGEEVVLSLEHSLISLSKWESKHQKPFLSAGEKTSTEIMDYLGCMVVTPDVDTNVLYRCSKKNISDIQEYIDSKQTATTFGMMPEQKGPGEVITSELIYYWMVAFTIPWEAQYWHLNRLFALIRICNIKNAPPQKMSPRQIAERNHRLNAERKAALNTKG